MSAKETVRTVLGSGPVARVLRAANSAARLTEDQRATFYRRVTKKLPSAPDVVFRHTVTGGEEISVHLDGTIRRLYWTGTYETDALPLFTTYARTADAILDVGAAEGIYTLFAAAVNSNARILSFEAAPQQYERLRANLAENALLLGDRVQVVTAALADHHGTAKFYEVSGGTSSLNPDFRPGSPSLEVEVTPGDPVVADLLEGHQVDLVKVDTESTEPAVLRGLGATIARDRPVIFCEVLAGRTEVDLQLLLDQWGYRTYWLGADGPVRRHRIQGDPTNRYANWLFLPDDRPPLGAPSGR